MHHYSVYGYAESAVLAREPRMPAAIVGESGPGLAYVGDDTSVSRADLSTRLESVESSSEQFGHRPCYGTPQKSARDWGGRLGDNSMNQLLRVVVFGVQAARLIRVMLRLIAMPHRGLRMLSTGFMLVLCMTFCRFAVMLRGFFVMVRCLGMVLAHL